MTRARFLLATVVVAAAFGVSPAGASSPRTAASPCSAHTVYRARHDPSTASISFSDSASQWGAVAPLTGMLGHALAVGDVNNDGWVDVFVGTFADRPVTDYAMRGASGPNPDQLLLGGSAGFTVDSAFPGSLGRTSGAVFADLDGDGAVDLVVARNVRDAPRGRAPTEILRNLGDGKFERAATLDQPAGARAVGLLDVDADGDTDLFVLEDRWAGSSSVLLRNDGDFNFTDVTKAEGLPTKLFGLGVSTADLNGDGRPDLFVSGSNRLFASSADHGFDAVDSSAFEAETFGSEDDPGGVAAGDLDGDGRIDLVVGQHYGSTTDQNRRVPIRVFMNRTNAPADAPRFEELGTDSGLGGLRSRAPHVDIADFDDDGRPDVLVGVEAGSSTPLVYRNVSGSGAELRFEAVAAPSSTNYWAAGAVADFDHDGRLDVVLAPFDPARATVFARNVGTGGHWWAISAPAGAKVTVSSAAGTRTAVVVNGSTGFSSGAAAIAWFGLASPRAMKAQVLLADGREVKVDVTVDRLVRLDC